MRILDKPIATAGMGVACAIALLFVLSGPYLTNTNLPNATPANSSDLFEQNSLTSTVSSVTSSATISSPNYVNATATQTLTAAITTTVITTSSATTVVATVSAGSAGVGSGGSSALFAFNSVNLAASGNRSAEFFMLGILAILSLVVALGSMYFVRRKSLDSAPEIETSPS